MADTTANPVPRVPKLKYRTALSTDEHTPSSASPRNIRNLELHPLQNMHGTPPTAPSRTSSLKTQSSSGTTSSKPPSLASSTASSHEFKSTKKSKSSSVFGFLSLKEPSQLALEQFAEQQRKQSVKASPSSPTVVGFAGKKLPASVPKVNSKWDGAPEKLKSRSSGASQMSRDRSSISSRSTRDSQSTSAPWPESRGSTSTNGRHDRPNTITSSMTSGSHLVTYQGRPSVSSSPASIEFPEISWYLTEGDEPVASGALPLESPRADSFHASVAKAPSSPIEPVFESSRESDEFSDLRSESPASSTGSVDTIVRDTAEALFNKLNHRPHRGLWTEDAPAVRLPTGHIPDAVPESHNFLFNLQPIAEQVDDPLISSPSIDHYSPTRQVQNFSRPMSSGSDTSPTTSPVRQSSYRRTPLTSGLPTLYELSLASTESLETVRDNSDAYSIAPSSIAPSELSTQWFDSPRERLGLGGRLRKNDILPWEKAEDKPKKSRLSIFRHG